MVRADMMDCIHTALCYAKRKKDPLKAPPFGSVKVLLVGDLYQLPPIVTGELQPAFSNEGEWKSPYFFDAHCLRDQALSCVELTKVHRLSDEPGRDEFLACLGKVREGLADAKVLDQLHRGASTALENPIHLTGTRAKAEKINLEQLEKLNAYPRTYNGRLEGQIEYKENDFPSPLQLTLKEGAQVMITKNVPANRLVNGMMGVVEQMGRDSIAIRLKGDGRNNEIVTLTEEGWDQHKHSYNRDKKEIQAEKTGTFYQFPLKLGWAVTIHKSQGLTLPAAVLDIDRAFAYGQIYVALSRVRRLKDLLFVKPLSRTDIKADSRIGRYLATRVDYKLRIQ
jgi:ATP-dependent exoDNAse (exonuclease V) alpha subunit